MSCPPNPEPGPRCFYTHAPNRDRPTQENFYLISCSSAYAYGYRHRTQPQRGIKLLCPQSEAKVLEDRWIVKVRFSTLVCPGGIRSDKSAGLILAKVTLCSEMAIMRSVLLYRASNSDNNSLLLTWRESPLFVPRSIFSSQI